MNKTQIISQFKQATDLDSLKRIYVKLLRENHPDKGGSTEICQLINSCYDEFVKNPFFAFRHEAHGKDDYSEWTETHTDYSKISDVLRQKLMAVLPIENINVELCGLWLWITGETRAHSNELKMNGFRWSPKKSAWYFHEEGYHKHGKRHYSLEEIRQMHGSSKFTRQEAIA